MKKCSARRVLVTGADSTARVIAETFAASGAGVVACDVREAAVTSLNESDSGVFATQADVGNEEDVARLYDMTMEQLGGIDVLVNVVGIAGPTKPTEELSTDDWRESMRINLDGVFFTCRAVIPQMKSRRSGVIINFSTGSTRTLLPNRSPYIVSKFAVEGLTRNLARELGPFNIRVNAILPGMIDNDRIRAVMQRLADAQGVAVETVMDNALQYISMRTPIQPQELADTVCFLASEKAAHISGQLLGVDGNVEWEG